MRSLVAEAKCARMLSSEEAEKPSNIPKVKQACARRGKLATREQAKELLAPSDRSKLKSKRNNVILSCRSRVLCEGTELAELDITTIQQRKGRWVLADLGGKERDIRIVAIPIWVKHKIDAWTVAANIGEGKLPRLIWKGGKIDGEILTGWAVWSIVEQVAKQIGIERFGPHDLRRTCAKLCRKAGGIWNRSSSCWDTLRSKRQSAIWSPSRRLPSP